MSSPVQRGAVTLVGVPSDANSSYMRGAARAPRRIREALFSESANLWTEDGRDLGAPGILDDLGDLDLGPRGGDFEALEERTQALLREGRRLIALGGDHSITYPLVRAHRELRGPFAILHLDAHPDLYASFDDNPHSHASPFARICEEGLATRLVQVGLRTLTGHLREQVERFGVEVIEMRDWERVGELSFDEPVYLSVDLDVLDPAFAPGVSHWEPGGASTRQVLDLIAGLDTELVGADVVELNPRRDPLGITAMVAGRIVREIAGKMV